MRAWPRPTLFTVLAFATLGLAMASAYWPLAGVLVLAAAGFSVYFAFSNPIAGIPEMPTLPGEESAEGVVGAPRSIRMAALVSGLVAALLLMWWTTFAWSGFMGEDHEPTGMDRFLAVMLGASAFALLVGSGRAAKA